MKKRTLILCGLLLSISLLAGCQTQEAATADKTQEASDISAEDTQEEDGQASDTESQSRRMMRHPLLRKMYPVKQHPLRFPLKKKRAR